MIVVNPNDLLTNLVRRPADSPSANSAWNFASVFQPVSAQNLYTTLRQHQSIGLATVYRSLEVLKLRDWYKAAQVQTGSTLQFSGAGSAPFDLPELWAPTPLDTRPVESLEAQLQQSAAFTIYYHSLEFFGLCQPCTPTWGRKLKTLTDGFSPAFALFEILSSRSAQF